jgi:hypothetical protein
MAGPRDRLGRHRFRRHRPKPWGLSTWILARFVPAVALAMLVLVELHAQQSPAEPAGARGGTADAATAQGAEGSPAAQSPRGKSPPGTRLGRAAGQGSQAQTSIFGSHGTGAKFVYVFDRSNSMNDFEGRPLSGAKRELIASLADLERIHQFQIVFYNERLAVFNPHYPQSPRMEFGDATTKRRAEEFVRRMEAGGGTRHMDALKLALGMRPDVIFFVTDAGEPRLSAKELEDILRRNERVGARINAIEFGVGPAAGGTNFLVQLAEQNHGEHVYVDVTKLPLD